MANGKITKELKGLGTKINEKEPNGETISEVIKGISDDYEGGGSGATYTAGNGIAITEENVINADVKVIETSNITGLTTEQCEALNVGDVVIKLTSNQKHTYTVSYKEAGVGMCLTYVDASVSETVSYDYTDGNWVYNSTDVTELYQELYQNYIKLIGYTSDDGMRECFNLVVYSSQNINKQFDKENLTKNDWFDLIDLLKSNDDYTNTVYSGTSDEISTSIIVNPSGINTFNQTMDFQNNTLLIFNVMNTFYWSENDDEFFGGYELECVNDETQSENDNYINFDLIITSKQM